MKKRFQKRCLSTQLKDLYGIDKYQSHIEVDREYWWYFTKYNDIPTGWHKIKITYIRSGCAFYVLSDMPDVPEQFFPTSCFMAATLVFAEIDPTKDLEGFGESLDKIIYRFDDEHTIVHNWSNEEEFEIETEENPLYFVIKSICKEIKV